MSEPVVAPIRVLIVDDHPLLRDGVGACLCQDPGIALVGQAGNGEEALQEAARLRPDLILMDIGMGAWQEAAVRKIQQAPETAILPQKSWLTDLINTATITAKDTVVKLYDQMAGEAVGAKERVGQLNK